MARLAPTEKRCHSNPAAAESKAESGTKQGESVSEFTFAWLRAAVAGSRWQAGPWRETRCVL
jgi:hypothetical protein